ncbi:MAG: hypothetical protein HMLKMBBP_03403 [Planctomycetes bacterium]|nr:hypothetical protein [Planctomycetota bacterium]
MSDRMERAAAERRDRMRVILPGLVLVCLYIALHGASAERGVLRARNALAASRASAPADDVLRASMEQLEAAERAVAMRRAAPEPPAPPPTPASDVLGAFSRHGVRLLEESAAPAGSERSLPPVLAKAARSAAMRTIRVEGRFLPVLRALTELAAGSPSVVPASLRMTVRAGTAAPEWSLVLWM